MKEDVVTRMEGLGIYPNDRLGQHILINQNALSLITSNVSRGSHVLEIGPGPGNMTEILAQRARKVVAIEIDKKFEPILSTIQDEHANLEVIYKDALSVNLRNLMKSGLFSPDWQLIANLPFHITEPLLKIMIDLPIADAVLILGKQMVDRIQIDNPFEEGFSRTGLIVQTFYDSSVLANLPSRYFYPEPGTDSGVVLLTPKDKAEYRSNRRLSILKHLFLTESKHMPTGKVIKEAYGKGGDGVVRSKAESHRHDRRENRSELKSMWRRGIPANSEEVVIYDSASRVFDKMGLPNDILNQPFFKLDNQDLKDLVVALDSL